MTTVAVIIAIIGISVVVCSTLGTLWQREKKRRVEAETKLSQKDACIAHLVKHAEELAVIEKEHDVIDKKIEEAKSDEEIADIVAAIITANNSRVQNTSKGK